MPNPKDAVFTTALVQKGKIIFEKKHIKRLKEHAQKLGIKVPNFTIPTTNDGLVKVEVREKVNFTFRKKPTHHETIHGITTLAPFWDGNITGLKHGDWQPYLDARKKAEDVGVEIALLIRNHCIVDSDRAMPMVLDSDGSAWIAKKEQGGVQSITFDCVKETILNAGIPINSGFLNERIVARCHEFILLGTGIGCARLVELDGVKIGNGTNLLQTICQKALEDAYNGYT